MRTLLQWLAALALMTALASPPLGQETEEPAQSCFMLADKNICITEAGYTADVCSAIATYADHFSLPRGFLARLIWQESRFDPQAISPAGAQGIAQFMPSTARLRTLQNPFDPAEALARSAEYLRFLEQKFGNLGLAAAAYNGGENRITRYVENRGGLPGETRAFVSIITGRSADYWLKQGEPVDYALHPEQPFEAACIEMAKATPMPRLDPSPGEWQPWGVLIAQNFSADIARAAFDRTQNAHPSLLGDKKMLLITVRNRSMGTRIRYSAQVGFAERGKARDFCRQLQQAGGTCIVQRNGS